MMAVLLTSAACHVTGSWIALRQPPLAQQLSLELSSERETYVVGEPVQFHLAVRNISDKPVRGDFGVYVYATSPKVMLEYRSATDAAYLLLNVGGRKGHNLPVSPTELAPGEALSSRDEALGVDWDRKTLILDKPTRYEFRATYCEPGDRNTLVQSNVWAIEVEAPSDRHRDAYEAYKKLDAASLVTWPLLFVNLTSDEAIAAFDFLEQFPDSPWAKHVRRGLVPAVENRVLHQEASPEEAQRVRLLRERETAEQAAGP